MTLSFSRFSASIRRSCKGETRWGIFAATDLPTWYVNVHAGPLHVDLNYHRHEWPTETVGDRGVW
jgi:hypothetical protein